MSTIWLPNKLRNHNVLVDSTDSSPNAPRPATLQELNTLIDSPKFQEFLNITSQHDLNGKPTAIQVALHSNNNISKLHDKDNDKYNKSFKQT